MGNYSEEIKEIIARITNEKYKLESLLRILISCLEEPELGNLKPYDAEILALVVYEKLNSMKDDFDTLNLEFDI